MSSSPDGLRYSQAEFLARWMPSSNRAGVILSPSTDLVAASLRGVSSVGSSSPAKPDDSFSSDFAPLPASADSSCLAVDGFAAHTSGGERAGSDSPASGSKPAHMDSLDEAASSSQDVSLMMKLEQLRKWQQHMQEQLKAHQLEELLLLQEEQQQRLLGRTNGAEDCAADDSECFITRREGPPRSQTRMEDDDDQEDTWHSVSDDQEDVFQEQDDTIISSYRDDVTEDRGRKDDAVLQDRPIKPGIGGHKQTFEELLEEQLRLEDQRLKSAQQQQSQAVAEAAVQAPPKRPFLKRGQGLSRFTNNRKAPLRKNEVKTDSRPQQGQVRVMSRSNSEPSAVQRGSTNQRLPVQRKTAVLNKENRLKGLISPPQLIRADGKAARTVLGSYQRLNTQGAESGAEWRLSKPQNTIKPGPHNTQPNPVTKQVGVFGAERYAAKERNAASAEERTTVSEEEEEGDKVPVHSFDSSFQEKLQSWECDRQVENMELGEFELLEQAADELSFSSNSSFVMKVLQMDQHHRQLQAAQGLHQRRLSSTPIKSPPRGELQRSSSDGLTRKSSSEAFAVNESDVSATNRRRSVEDKREPSSCGGSESEDRDDVAVKAPTRHGDFSFPAQSHRPYDKWSYQDEDGASDAEQGGGSGGGDESTLIEDKDGQRVVFDDDDTWNDVDEISPQLDDDSSRDTTVSAATAASVSPPTQTLLRKVAASKVVEISANQEPEPPPHLLPPASQLMTKLFPSLKPKTQNATLPPPAAASESKKLADETSQQLQSRQLRERLVELEIEIERFQKENVALAKLRQENEKNQENLRKERLEFERTKAEESAKFEEYKKEENRKLQRERKLFEKHVSAARAIPDKKEREEIQVLKQQLNSLQEELRRKESRWASSHSRQRQHIETLSEENGSLRDEIRMLEKLRLSSWKKNSASAEKDKETKDGPRMFPNNLSTVVTKGVKFASPLDSRGSSSSSAPQGGAAAACRRSSAEIGQGVSGIKSSLRRPSSGAGGASSSSPSSSSSLPVRRVSEEKSTAGNTSQEKPPNQEPSENFSPQRDSLSTESESREPEEAETPQEVITHPDGKIEKVLVGGDRVILFSNGTRKELTADGLTVKVTFFNGDTKQITADQRVIYFYSEAQTTHVTFPDGMEVLHFPNNQTEKLFPDGRKEITYPDQTVKNLFPDGREESVLTDGTIIQVNPDGTKEIHFNTGQREIHTDDYKRREYPDGTVKTVYADDGRQETHYPTGRVRIKDRDGNVLMDIRE